MLKVIAFLVFFSCFFIPSGNGQQTVVKYLSGTGADDTKDWEFYCSDGRNSKKWTTIAVPSCWEQQGFGAYYYGYGKGDRLYETGHYRTNFHVPAEWKNKQVEIVFEGVMTDAVVMINGISAGPPHQGAFYRFRYNISTLLRYGKNNQLDVLVKKQSDNSSVNRAERDADYWVFGGIFRPVYLEVKPRTHISDIAINAEANGHFKADVYLAGSNMDKIRVDINPLKGKGHASFEYKATPGKVHIEGSIDPQTWSPEFPNLYKATFSLIDNRGEIIHTITQRIGFRTIACKEGDGIYINGVKIKLKGVCRHTFHPHYGRTSSKSISIQVVKLMKEMNMNAVRMSHYPPDVHFLDVCDSLGLFVLDELAGWQHPYDDTAGLKLLHEMISRDVNHPSVILWDNGNEGGWNTRLDSLFEKLDIQKRKVLHPWQSFGMFNTYHYMDYNYLSHDDFNRRKIFIPTEFLHGLYDGGSGAGLDDYWDKMWNDPLCAGGFLWSFADEAVERTDKGGMLDTYGNEAPDGILGPYNEKEGSFYTIKEIWSPVWFEKRLITPAFNGVFHIENRYHFTDLNQCTFYVDWLQFPDPNDQDTTVKYEKQEIIKMNLSPGQEGSLAVTMPERWQNMDAIRIRVKDPYGMIINTWSWPLKTACNKSEELIAANPQGPAPHFADDGDALTVNVKELQLTFDKQQGKLLSVNRKGKTIPLSNGPVFINKKDEAEQIKYYYNNRNFVIHISLKNGDSFTWTVRSDGLVLLDVAYRPVDNSFFAGISFDYPENKVAGMRWLGNGPYRVYKNRMKGVKFGLWEKQYNNTVTGRFPYEYPEFKGYHSNVYWVEVQGKESPDFTIYMKTDDIFFRMLTPEEPEDAKNARMKYPEGDISFLNGINSIGTKFKHPAEMGPQSAPLHFNSRRFSTGELTISLLFDFRHGQAEKNKIKEENDSNKHYSYR